MAAPPLHPPSPVLCLPTTAETTTNQYCCQDDGRPPTKVRTTNSLCCWDPGQQLPVTVWGMVTGRCSQNDGRPMTAGIKVFQRCCQYNIRPLLWLGQRASLATGRAASRCLCPCNGLSLRLRGRRNDGRLPPRTASCYQENQCLLMHPIAQLLRPPPKMQRLTAAAKMTVDQR